MKLIHWIMAVALFTASFDTILVLQVAGTIRMANVMEFLLMAAAIALVIQRGTVLWPRGGSMLVLWCVLQGVLITRSSLPSFSVNMYVLLIFSVLGVFAALQLYGRSPMLESLMRLYLQSFVFVAGFGLFQFVTPGLGVGEFLVRQWIAYGKIPRISGFNYEPSYFATYLVMGWIMLIDLRVNRAKITEGRGWKRATILVTAVFFLSTSKTAWVFLPVEALARLFPALLQGMRRQLHRFSRGSLLVPLPRAGALVLIPIALLVAAGTYKVVSQVVDPTIFLSGSGLSNTSNQSVTDRLNNFKDTVEVVREHPFIGLGFGGVEGRLAELRGITIHNMDDYRLNWPFPVPVEVLASSGLLGVIPFVWFFLAITAGNLPLMRANWDDERAKWLHALIRAMVYEWLILVVDQNLFRVYFWLHVTMLVIVGYHLRFERIAAPPTPALMEALATV